MLVDQIFIDVQSQTRPIRKNKLTIPDGIPPLHQAVSPGYIELAKGFLDDEVGRTDIDMKARG